MNEPVGPPRRALSASIILRIMQDISLETMVKRCKVEEYDGVGTSSYYVKKRTREISHKKGIGWRAYQVVQYRSRSYA